MKSTSILSLLPTTTTTMSSSSSPPTRHRISSSLLPSPTTTTNSLHIAVIGAGAAGLVAARELRREGHGVVVFERSGGVGGTWVYESRVELDSLGRDPSREIVHSSLYESLRTNLPRECMGFFDYPFVAKEKEEGRDPRRFPGHREVLKYLEDFARDFDLYRLVRFRTEVLEVEMAEDRRWAVRSRSVDGGGSDGGGHASEEVYDGVVVCNGHFTVPRIAEIPGVDSWPGKQLHSHNYRAPEPFLNQVVVLIGSSASAADISRDISKFAKEVHIASRSTLDETPTKQLGYDNIWLHTMIENANKDGRVTFQDGSSFIVDVILHCTGYKYHFPFLRTSGIVNVDDNRVCPLYKHIFPPSLSPWLSFVGIPWKVIPFPMFELQSKWIAGALSGRIALPNEEDMMEDINASYAKIEAVGWPKRYTHNFSHIQFEYDDWLAAECGYPAVEEWRKQMYSASSKNKVDNPENYRDEWEDHHLILQAQEDFKRILGQ